MQMEGMLKITRNKYKYSCTEGAKNENRSIAFHDLPQFGISMSQVHPLCVSPQVNSYKSVRFIIQVYRMLY